MTSTKKQWYKKWWGIALIMLFTLITALIIAFGFYFFSIIKQINPLSQDQNSLNLILNGEQYQAEGEKKYWLGSASPKVTIVEFGDYNCPMCKNSYSKIREISVKYKDNIKIIYRDYPFYENSLELSLAARCAGEQGLFWLMHDKLFQNQGGFNLDYLPELANQIGADVDKFNNCLNSQKYLNDIKKDFTDAESLGVTGTPTWFINGYKVEGDMPYNIFIELIESLLKL